MTDHLTKEMRSWNMSRIRSKHTKPELIMRSLLHRLGFRFRLNNHRLPGSPDIVLSKFKTVIFIHGCFWHRHENCRKATTPNTNREYWINKFESNVTRDKKNKHRLISLGWKVIVLWECEINADPVQTVMKTVYCLSPLGYAEYKTDIDSDNLLRVAERRGYYYLKTRG